MDSVHRLSSHPAFMEHLMISPAELGAAVTDVTPETMAALFGVLLVDDTDSTLDDNLTAGVMYGHPEYPDNVLLSMKHGEALRRVAIADGVSVILASRLGADPSGFLAVLRAPHDGEVENSTDARVVWGNAFSHAYLMPEEEFREEASTPNATAVTLAKHFTVSEFEVRRRAKSLGVELSA